MLRVALPTLLVILSACSANPPPPPPAESSVPLAGQCSQPRPQVCTMEYDPVCAELSNGSRSDYSSPCNACAHDLVTSYTRGTCAAPAGATGAGIH